MYAFVGKAAGLLLGEDLGDGVVVDIARMAKMAGMETATMVNVRARGFERRCGVRKGVMESVGWYQGGEGGSGGVETVDDADIWSTRRNFKRIVMLAVLVCRPFVLLEGNEAR